MSKILGYVLVGLGAAAVSGGTTFYITQKIVKKKCKEKYEQDLAMQLNGCREYYKRKIHNEEVKCVNEPAPEDDEDIVEEYSNEEEAKSENDIDELVIRDEKTYKIRASEIAQNMEVKSYHRMYGEPTVDMVINEDEDDDLPVIEPEGPHCIRSSVFWDNEDGHDLVEIHVYTGDFIRKEDGEKEWIEVIYCNGYLNDKRDENGNIIPLKSDDPWRERVLKSSEAAAILGDDWRKWMGNDEWEPVNEYGFDYTKDEACVKNNLLNTDFIINRINEMYKVAIEGKEPGDPFDYDSIR